MNVFKLIRFVILAVLVVVVGIWAVPVILRYFDLLQTMSR